MYNKIEMKVDQDLNHMPLHHRPQELYKLVFNILWNFQPTVTSSPYVMD